MLQQRGFYTISLGNGKKIPLRFCHWTFKRFCEINGNMTLAQFQNAIGAGLSFWTFSSLVLCAAEYVCIKEKREFDYSDIDASDWIDEIGGITGGAAIEITQLIVEAFTDSGSNGKEKKIPVKEKI